MVQALKLQAFYGRIFMAISRLFLEFNQEGKANMTVISN